MGDYLVLTWPQGAPPAAARQARAALAREPGWNLALDGHELCVFVSDPAPPPLVWTGGAVVIGEVFDAAAARRGQGAALSLRGGDRSAEALFARLTTQGFGAWVAIAPTLSGRPDVARDPLGQREVVIWRRGEVVFIGSRLPQVPEARPADLAVDWPALGRLLCQKALTSAVLPLVGLDSLAPGEALLAGRRISLWTPAGVVRAARGTRARSAESLGPDALGPEALARVIDGTVAALSANRRPVLCEISGGLDSAIVASALERSGARVTGAVNHYWREVEADERRFAQAVADQAGWPLATVARGLLQLDSEKVARATATLRPSWNAVDPDHDADLAARLRPDGARALMTGQGGDAVFCQMVSHQMVVDLLRDPGADLAGGLVHLSRRTQRSIWRLLAGAPSAALRPPGLASPPPFAVGGGRDPHPWLRDLGGVAPGKAIQIRALVANLSVFGDCPRARAGDLVHPLLAQPVVETCLAIPTPILALGAGDRPFARAAFADRLPAIIRDRRAKSDLSAFFSQSLAASLDFLGPFLLQGRLAEHGLIDPDRLAPLLDAGQLIQEDHAGALFAAIMLEGWARHWSGGAGDEGEGGGS